MYYSNHVYHHHQRQNFETSIWSRRPTNILIPGETSNFSETAFGFVVSQLKEMILSPGKTQCAVPSTCAYT